MFFNIQTKVMKSLLILIADIDFPLFIINFAVLH